MMELSIIILLCVGVSLSHAEPGKIITFTTEFDDDLATTQPCERLCNRSVPLGRMLQLYCEANVDKSDRFSTDLRWYKDGKTVPGPFDDERHYSIDSYILSDLNTGAYNRRASLKIERTEQNDSAEYTCSSRNNSEQYENITVNINIVDMPEVPVGVKVVSNSSRSVKLAWEKPWNSVDNKSSFIEYFVKYKTIDESWLNDSKMLSVKSNENNVEITELRPATSYNVRIFAKNDYFQSAPFEMDVITTDENSKPSGQPRNIKIESTKPNSLRVSWKSPPRSEWNGEISGYKLGYWLSNGSEMACHYENFKIDSSELNEDKEFSFEIVDLQPNIQYSIVIHAYNQFGAGPRSDEYKQYTIKNIPNSPDWYIECTPLHSNILGVSWDIRNDISSYTVIYTEQKLWNNAERKEHVFTKKSYATLDELKSHTNYTIQVLATTSTGDSEESDPIDCATLDAPKTTSTKKPTNILSMNSKDDSTKSSSKVNITNIEQNVDGSNVASSSLNLYYLLLRSIEIERHLGLSRDDVQLLRSSIDGKLNEYPNYKTFEQKKITHRSGI